MRAAFVRTLVDLAAHDPRILLLTADLGFMAVEPFVERFPDRFYNVGVAEQNMVGIATGLAEAGYLPFVYSIAPFATLRPYEFIRNGPVHHELPVRIVGIGGGFEYGSAGPTHFALEDIAVMRALNGMAIFAPADHHQAETVLRATWDLPGPVYYRIGKDDRTVAAGLEGRFSIGKMECVRDGQDVLLVAMGGIASEVVAAAERLEACGIDPAVHVVASIAPSPAADLAAQLARHSIVVTVEAHLVEGGLGSLVAEVIAERGIPCRLHRIGVNKKSQGLSGSQRYMHQLNGLDREALAARVRSVVGEHRR